MTNQDFLARWSRRKQEARDGHLPPRLEEPDQANGPEPVARPEAEQGSTGTDISSLPAIESIDAATDITAFLHKGIPQELSRAALRRAWTSDPAIRDFVGLAENAWDFNEANAMPGFGPLDYSAEQLERLGRQIVGRMAQAGESLPGDPAGAAPDSEPSVSSADLPQRADLVEMTPHDASPDEIAPAEPQPTSAAPQSGNAAVSGAPAVRRRTHGGAVPR